MIFNEVVDELFKQWDEGFLRDRAGRIALIDELIERYYSETGRYPAGYELDRLATLILKEELTDRRRNKMKVVDYPIMSDRWLKTRTDKEVSFKLADEVGVDRRSYRKPTRKYL